MSNKVIILWHKYKIRGVKWFLQRFFQELCGPQTRFSRFLAVFFKKPIYRLLIKPLNALHFAAETRKSFAPDAFLLIYDLRIEPITFNFIWALVIADYQRRQRGLSYLDVMIIKGDFHGLRQEDEIYETACSIAARHWRVQSIIFGALNLVPQFRHLFYVDKQEAEVNLQKYPYKYPNYYSIIAPVTHQAKDGLIADPSMRCLKADAESLKLMQKWLAGRVGSRKIICITLRQSVYYPERNSNLASWLAFAKSLDPNEYYVVFIPDTEVNHQYANGKLDIFDCCINASINVQLRMALYELSELCLGINNGPMALCWFNSKCNYVMFRVVTEDAPQTSTRTLKKDFELGTTPIFAAGKQFWIWQDDDFSVIQDALTRLHLVNMQSKIA